MLRTRASTNSSTSVTQIIVEYDGIDDGGNCSGDFNRKFYQPLTSRLRTSSSTDLSTSVTQSVVKYDKVDGGGKSVKKLSKGQKIVKKSEKPQKPEKLQRLSVRRNVYQSTNPPSKNSSFRYNSDSFLGSFCWTQELSKYYFHFDYCQNKAGCHIVFIRGTSFLLFICKTRVLSPPNSGDAPRKKTSQPLIKAKMLDGGEVVKEVVHLQDIIIRALWYRENCTTRY